MKIWDFIEKYGLNVHIAHYATSEETWLAYCDKNGESCTFPLSQCGKTPTEAMYKLDCALFEMFKEIDQPPHNHENSSKEGYTS